MRSTGVDPTLDASDTTAVNDGGGDGGHLAVGAQVGRYTVVRVVGAGAMGVVYEARDPELGRSVAVKVLPAGRHGLDVRLRLAREAQALAQLQHPNVVAIHEVGVGDERVFLAMELVDGTTLDQHLRQRRASWREILALYVQAGRGLAAAHAKGLVHRDFKPANVLVDRDGRVRVGDFGLARAVDDAELPVGEAAMDPGLLTASLTATGAFLGTPRYMAPELFARRPATPASDQFAYCVAMWEALFDQHPFAGGKDLGGLAATVQKGRAQTPPRGRAPRAVVKLLARGLDIDPARRHPSMAALVAALEAVPVRRRRVAVALALTGLVAATAFAGVWSRSSPGDTCARAGEFASARFAAIWSSDVRERVRAAFVATGAPYAPAAFDSIDAAFRGQQPIFAGAHRTACEATQVRGEQSEALLDLRVQCLARAHARVGALVDVFTRADATTVERAASAAAATDVDACADVSALAGLVPRPADRDVRRRIAAIEARVAALDVAWQTGRYREGLALDDGVIEDARATGWSPLLADALVASANLEEAGGDMAIAEQRAYGAVDAAEAGHADVTAALALHRLVWVVGYRGSRFAEGAVLLRIARAATARAGSPLPVLANLLTAEGAFLQQQGRLAEALAVYRDALVLRAATPLAPTKVLPALLDLASVLRELGRYDEARPLYVRALALSRALNPQHPFVAASLNNFGIFLREIGDYEEAARMGEQAVALRERLFGPEDARVALAIHNLAATRTYQGRLLEARELYQRTIAIREKTIGAAHPLMATTMSNLAIVAHRLGDYDEALRLHERAVKLHIGALGPTNRAVINTLDASVGTHIVVGQLDAARREIQMEMAAVVASGIENTPDGVLPLVGMGQLALREGRASEGRGHLEQALGVQQTQLQPRHPDLVSTLVPLVDACLATGDRPAAARAATLAAEIDEVRRLPVAERALIRLARAKVLWVSASRDDRAQARALALEARELVAGIPLHRRELDAWLASHRL